MYCEYLNGALITDKKCGTLDTLVTNVLEGDWTTSIVEMVAEKSDEAVAVNIAIYKFKLYTCSVFIHSFP